MTVMLVLVWILAGLYLIGLEMELTRARRARREPVRPDPCLGAVLGLPPARVPPTESQLQARLAAGAISRERYRAEMALLAARDERAHPVGPPPA